MEERRCVGHTVSLCAMQQTGSRARWRSRYELSAHVPMILRWPERFAAAAGVRISRGTVVGAAGGVVTELRDVLHTVLDAAGLVPAASPPPPPGNFAAEDGKSLLCLLRDPSGASHCAYAWNPGPGGDPGWRLGRRLSVDREPSPPPHPHARPHPNGVANLQRDPASSHVQHVHFSLPL